MTKTLLRPLFAMLAALGFTAALTVPAHATQSTNCGWATTDSGASSRWCAEVHWDRNGVGADVNKIVLYKDGGKALKAEYDLLIKDDFGNFRWGANNYDWLKDDGQWTTQTWTPRVWANTPAKVVLQLNARMGEGDGEPAWAQVQFPVWIGQDW